MNNFINLLNRALAVMNERRKEMNTAARIGSLFRDILNYFGLVTDDLALSVDILAVTKADNSRVDALVNGIIKQPAVDTYRMSTDSLASIYGLTTSDNGSNGEAKKNGWDVLVRHDETKGGVSNRYNWNGTSWIDLETGNYPEEVATKLEVETRLFRMIDFIPQEIDVIRAIKSISFFGTTDTFKLVSIINSVDSPHKVGIYNIVKKETTWLYFNTKNEIQKDLGDSAFVYMYVDWEILGDKVLNVSVEGGRLIFSDICYSANIEAASINSTITSTKTFTKSPIIPEALSYNAPLRLAQFASLIVEPLNFTNAELACISAIKHFSVEGSIDIFKIGILLNTSSFPTRLWLYNTTRNRVEKLEFKGERSITYTTAEGAKINANIDWVQLGNNGINSGEPDARLVISSRCYIKKIASSLLSQGNIMALMGDSIMAQMSGYGDDEGLDVRGYPRLQKRLAFQEIINCAIGGSTWQDRTVITDSPTEGTAVTTGCISNQVLKLKRLVSEGRPIPNLIVIAAGTNSSGGRGDFEAVMAMSYDELKADMDTRRTFYGGMRYSLELALREFPNVQIILFAPIQSTDHPNRTFELLLSNAKAIEQMANRYAIPFVNSLLESGINDLVNSNMYLSDKVHLTEHGKEKYSDFIANKVIQNFHRIK